MCSTVPLTNERKHPIHLTAVLRFLDHVLLPNSPHPSHWPRYVVESLVRQVSWSPLVSHLRHRVCCFRHRGGPVMIQVWLQQGKEI